MDKKIIIVMSYFFLLSFVSCERIKNPLDPELYEVLTKINIVDFNITPWPENNFEIDPFTVDNIAIYKDILIIDISYNGGNNTHKFQLYCSTLLYETSPPQRDLWLSHNSNNDIINKNIKKRLRFDLTTLKSDDYNSVFLRIHEYGKSEPIRPFPLYEF